MGEWVYFTHPPRENFAATLSEEERAVFSDHFDYLEQLLRDGVLVLAGPTLGPVNTGVTVIEAPDEDTARLVMEADPAVSSGILTPELRPMRVSLLRGRD